MRTIKFAEGDLNTLTPTGRTIKIGPSRHHGIWALAFASLSMDLNKPHGRRVYHAGFVRGLRKATLGDIATDITAAVMSEEEGRYWVVAA